MDAAGAATVAELDPAVVTEPQQALGRAARRKPALTGGRALRGRAVEVELDRADAAVAEPQQHGAALLHGHSVVAGHGVLADAHQGADGYLGDLLDDDVEGREALAPVPPAGEEAVDAFGTVFSTPGAPTMTQTRSGAALGAMPAAMGGSHSSILAGLPTGGNNPDRIPSSRWATSAAGVSEAIGQA